MKRIDVYEWIEQYQPIFDEGGQDCCGIDGCQMGFVLPYKAANLALSHGYGPEHIWTIYHDDGDDDVDEDNPWIISPGYGCVNVVGYVVTHKDHSLEDVSVTF